MDLQREFSVRIKFPLRLRGEKAKGGKKLKTKICCKSQFSLLPLKILSNGMIKSKSWEPPMKNGDWGADPQLYGQLPRPHPWFKRVCQFSTKIKKDLIFNFSTDSTSMPSSVERQIPTKWGRSRPPWEARRVKRNLFHYLLDSNLPWKKPSWNLPMPVKRHIYKSAKRSCHFKIHGFCKIGGKSKVSEQSNYGIIKEPFMKIMQRQFDENQEVWIWNYDGYKTLKNLQYLNGYLDENLGEIRTQKFLANCLELRKSKSNKSWS